MTIRVAVEEMSLGAGYVQARTNGSSFFNFFNLPLLILRQRQLAVTGQREKGGGGEKLLLPRPILPDYLTTN